MSFLVFVSSCFVLFWRFGLGWNWTGSAGPKIPLRKSSTERTRPTWSIQKASCGCSFASGRQVWYLRVAEQDGRFLCVPVALAHHVHRAKVRVEMSDIFVEVYGGIISSFQFRTYSISSCFVIDSSSALESSRGSELGVGERSRLRSADIS